MIAAALVAAALVVADPRARRPSTPRRRRRRGAAAGPGAAGAVLRRGRAPGARRPYRRRAGGLPRARREEPRRFRLADLDRAPARAPGPRRRGGGDLRGRDRALARPGRRARRARRRPRQPRTRRRRLGRRAGRRGARAAERRRPGPQGPRAAPPRASERGARGAEPRPRAEPDRRGPRDRPRAHPPDGRAPRARQRRARVFARRHPRGVNRRCRRRPARRRRRPRLGPRAVAGALRLRRHPRRCRSGMAAEPPRARARGVHGLAQLVAGRPDRHGGRAGVRGRAGPARHRPSLPRLRRRARLDHRALDRRRSVGQRRAGRPLLPQRIEVPAHGADGGQQLRRDHRAVAGDRAVLVLGRLRPRLRELRHPVRGSARALPCRHDRRRPPYRLPVAHVVRRRRRAAVAHRRPAPDPGHVRSRPALWMDGRCSCYPTSSATT